MRECIAYEGLASSLLESAQFYKLFEYILLPTFDVAADAFATFQLLLTQHQKLAANFLTDHYAEFFSKFDELLRSENYIAKRQALKVIEMSDFTIIFSY